MRNVAELTAGDRVTLNVHGREIPASYIAGYRNGCIIRTLSSTFTEHYVPWGDSDLWLSDPRTGAAFDTAPEEEPVPTTTPELE